MSAIKHFKKKPIAFPAIEIKYENKDEINEFLGNGIFFEDGWSVGGELDFRVELVSQDEPIYDGWLMKDINGKPYHISDEVLKATYDMVEV